MVEENKKNNVNVLLTIGDVIALGECPTPFRRKWLVARAAEHSCFGAYALTERAVHLGNSLELGKAWGVAQDAYALTLTSSKDWFLQKNAAEVRAMLRKVRWGLKFLGADVPPVLSVDFLKSHQELCYIALVAILVRHPAKEVIVAQFGYYWAKARDKELQVAA